MNELELLWKTDEQLGPVPMAIRALIMFIVALVLLRVGGIRIFGQKKENAMREANLSRSDLLESLRLETQNEVLDKVEQATLETNGRISFILGDE